MRLLCFPTEMYSCQVRPSLSIFLLMGCGPKTPRAGSPRPSSYQTLIEFLRPPTSWYHSYEPTRAPSSPIPRDRLFSRKQLASNSRQPMTTQGEIKTNQSDWEKKVDKQVVQYFSTEAILSISLDGKLHE